MNVQCPSCSTTFRVDPAKVPAGGVRARCSVCAAVFPVSVAPAAAAPLAAAPPIRTAAPPPPPPPPAADAGDPGAHAARRGADSATGGDAGDATSGAVVVTRSAGDPGRPSAAAAPGTTPLPQPVVPPRPAAGGRSVNPFLSQDPSLKARRLARALVSRHGRVPSGEAARCAQGGDREGVVQGGDHEELGRVRGAGGPRTRRLDAVLPGSAERDPG